MMMHHNTKFGNQTFGGLEDHVWSNTDILTLCCDLALECSHSIFFHKILWLIMMYYQTKFDCQGINSLEDIVELERIKFDYTSPLWPWPWFFPTRHSGSQCCIIVPSLVTKCSAVQKISERTFTGILKLDLECSNPIFPQDTLVYDIVLINQDWLQTDQQFRRYI